MATAIPIAGHSLGIRICKSAQRSAFEHTYDFASDIPFTHSHANSRSSSVFMESQIDTWVHEGEVCTRTNLVSTQVAASTAATVPTDTAFRTSIALASCRQRCQIPLTAA